MTQPMRVRATLANNETTVRVLMSHIMEPGTRRDASGALIPPHHITEVEARHNQKLVLQSRFGGAVSKDPFLSFKFKGGAKGDKVTIKWVDNHGATQTGEATIT
jgi:sulfur-oxidizing protein SoxZ